MDILLQRCCALSHRGPKRHVEDIISSSPILGAFGRATLPIGGKLPVQCNSYRDYPSLTTAHFHACNCLELTLRPGQQKDRNSPTRASENEFTPSLALESGARRLRLHDKDSLDLSQALEGYRYGEWRKTLRKAGVLGLEGGRRAPGIRVRSDNRYYVTISAVFSSPAAIARCPPDRPEDWPRFIALCMHCLGRAAFGPL